MGCLADCGIAFSHLIVVNQVVPCSKKSNLDHEPFHVKVGHLMHMLKKIFCIRPSRGLCKVVKYFAKPLPLLSHQKLQVHMVLSGEDEVVRR